MSVDARLDRLTHDLNLTEAQREKIRPIFQHEAQRIKAVRSNSSMTQGEARQKVRQIQRVTRQEVSQILTPEQRQQWKEERPGGGGGAPRGGGPRGGQPGSPPNPPEQPPQ
jgi:Spy/CpxP family protein refolding chaperone